MQFYEDSDFLCDQVADFIWTALGDGDPVVVVASRAHELGLRKRLEGRLFDVPRAILEGHIVFLDAETTLKTFMVGDEPDAALFDATVARVVRDARARHHERPLHAYGEMVDILLKRHNAMGAIRLEKLWNKLATSEEFSLLCGYCLGNFRSNEHTADFRSVCGLHSHVRPTETFSTIGDTNARLREVSVLQQRAKALEAEIERRENLERDLLRQTEEIRRREEEFRDFIENGVEGIHCVGRDGTILFANKAELDLLGYGRDEYVGHPLRDFHVDATAVEDLLSRLCTGETLRDYEVRLRCKDGSIKHVVIHSNVFWRDGEFVHTRCFTRDITDRKQNEKALESIAHELETANRMKDDFLATVSHELRTPLNAMLGWTRMLRTGGLSPNKQQRALETIERNANAQTQLIEDLLDVSRIISGKLRLNVGNVDLTAVVENAIDAVRPSASVKGVTIRHEIGKKVRSIVGDAERLQQVAWNLLTNAVKFTPPGGTVRVGVHQRESSVDIVVADDGRGIAPEFLSSVFERFRQADSPTTRSHGGLGLGLAIARHLTELHGGGVGVHSDGLGRGATFTVSLPVSPRRTVPSEHPPALRLALAPTAQQAPELDGIHVLVVDDEADARDLISEVLESCKARVTTAASAEEAIGLIPEVRPDIVVSDIAMPGEDGYDLIRKLRALPEASGRRTPAVALTAYTRFEDRTKALVAGFNMHVPKPVEPAELIAVLSNLTTMFGAARYSSPCRKTGAS